MCMCVDMYMVANLILLCFLKHISLVETLKHFQENMGYLFLWRASEYPLFSISRTLVHFLILFLSFMNKFCITHASFLQLKLFKRDIYQKLGAFILTNFFCVYSQCRSRTFLDRWKTCCCIPLV